MNTGSASNRVTIRRLTEHDSLDDLTELLHRAYAQLADMGLKFVATYQDVEVTRKRIAKGICLVAVLDDQIVGTITFYPKEIGKPTPWMERPDVAVIGQMGVEPSLQGQGIASMLMQAAEDCARDNGAAELALDTAEPATHLIAWYTRLGYRFIEYMQWDVTNYRSVVMSKTIR
jgi:GNAT superfamily N-acetyltransferase